MSLFTPSVEQREAVAAIATKVLRGYAPKDCPELIERESQELEPMKGRLTNVLNLLNDEPKYISVECDGTRCELADDCPVALVGIMVPITRRFLQK